MRIKRWTVPIVALFIVALACSQKTKSSQNAKDYSAFLYVPSGAESVRFNRIYEHDEVFYELREEFPATKYIENVGEFLKINGFKVQEFDFMNPGIRTGHYRGWSHFEDHTKNPPLMVYQWITDWRNDKGEFVRSRLRYSWPVGKPQNMKNLEVVSIFMPAETADSLRKWAQDFNEQKKKEKRGAP